MSEDTGKEPKRKKPPFWHMVWSVATRGHNSRTNGPLDESSNQIRLQATEAESSLVKFVATLNAGAVLATLALIGQTTAQINKAELVVIANGVNYFTNALILLGFGKIADVLSHSASWGKFWSSYALFRLVFLGLSVIAFAKFIWGVEAVLDALIAAL